MKGFLKSPDGIFQLGSRVTTVGREGCDLVLKTPGAEFQHAVIEYSTQDDCFVLQDLNTCQGTYINDCRVQNAAVRLAPGDVIRFGYGGMPHELELDNQSQVAYPPVHQRPAWTQPLTMVGDQLTSDAAAGLPQLRSMVNAPTGTWNTCPQQPQPLPRPPSMRSRPQSAGSATRRVDRPVQLIPSGTFIPNRTITGWVGGVALTRTQNGDVVPGTTVVEKEQRIQFLCDEVKRLAVYQTECTRKEDTIRQLRTEIRDLQNQLRQMTTNWSTSPAMSNDTEVMQRLMQMENELARKMGENENLREQLKQAQEKSQTPSPSVSNSVSRQDFNDRVMEMNSLRTELERVQKDKNIMAGLVTQMQRDMSNKDTTISRVAHEMENLRTEMREKDIQLTAMQAKFASSKEKKKSDDDVRSSEKEAAVLKLKLKAVEGQMKEKCDLIASLKEELEKVQEAERLEKSSQRKLQTELDQVNNKSQDLERAERLVRVDLEQLNKRIERFRNRVVQVTFSVPGTRTPDKRLNDDEVVDALKKIIDEKIELVKQIREMKQTISEFGSVKKESIDGTKRIKQHLSESLDTKDKKK
ncbi:Forkhead-associated domain-containing protein 1 [Lamellibrachia satsuma]|nr:Forkhead-associated domain-containing protein 1 [Lamellibrachia satsuma]